MGQITIAAYRPKEGQSDALVALAKDHYGILKGQNLVTDRLPVIARAKDGTVIEVFEWQTGALDRAHTDDTVKALWERFQAISDYTSLTELDESGDLFATFEAVN